MSEPTIEDRVRALEAGLRLLEEQTADRFRLHAAPRPETFCKGCGALTFDSHRLVDGVLCPYYGMAREDSHAGA